METYGSKKDDSKETGSHAGKSAEFTPPPPPERQIRVPIVLFDRHREQQETTEHQAPERRIEGHEDGTEGQSNERDDAEGKEKKEKGTGAARAFPVAPHAFRPIIPRPAEIHPNEPAKAKESTPEVEVSQQPTSSGTETNPAANTQNEVTSAMPTQTLHTEQVAQQETQVPTSATRERSQEIQNPLSHPMHAEDQPTTLKNESEHDDETDPGLSSTPEDPYAGMHGPEPAQQAAEASVPLPQAGTGTSGNQPPMPPNVPPVQSFGSAYPQPNYNVWNANSPYTQQQNANYYPGGPIGMPGINPNTAPSTPITTEHVPVYEKRSGVGAVAALLGLEYLARKRADKRQNKLIKENAKKQQESAEALQRSERQQRAFRTEQQKQAADMRRMQQVQERFGTPTALTPAAFTERSTTSAAPAMNSMPPIHERQVPGSTEVTPMPTNPVQPQSPKEHVVQEGLQAYRVDEYTVDPMTRDQAFFEQQHEIQRDPLTGAPRPRAAQAQYAEQQAQAYGAQSNTYSSHQYTSGFGGGSVGSGVGQAGASNPMLPSGMTTPYLPAGTPTHVDSQHQLPSVAPRQRATSGAPGVWFWVMLALIIAAFFAAALI